MKSFVRGHTASRWQSRSLHPGCQATIRAESVSSANAHTGLPGQRWFLPAHRARAVCRRLAASHSLARAELPVRLSGGHPRVVSGSTVAGQPQRGGSQSPGLTLDDARTRCVTSLSPGVIPSLVVTFVKSPRSKPQFPNLSRAALNQDQRLPRGMFRLRHAAVERTFHQL